MKKTILSIAIAAVLAACNNSKPVEQAPLATQATARDTAGYSQFQQWKEKQELIDAQGVNEQDQTNNQVATAEESKPAPKVIYRTIVKERPVVVSKPASHSSGRAVVRNAKSSGRVETSTGSGSTDNEGTGGISTGSNSGTSASNGDVVTTQPETKPAKNGGWSKAAKGTAIGAGSGAVLGAILSKNKGKGAVIGGVVGAAGGYVLGRMQDKKDGRY
jgi:outer membrane lipoprotein SlyB